MLDRRILVLTLSATAGCKGPEDAPQKLEDLCAYLFDHVDDEDDTLATEGVTNLAVWLDGGLDQLSDGYSVSNLDQSTLDELGDGERDASVIAGAAVASEAGDVSVEAVTDTLILANQLDVYSETYATYDREFEGDPDCFVAQECDYLEMRNDSVATLPLSIEIATEMHAQERWIETTLGPALLHRAWLEEPTSGGLLNLEAQYHLAVTLPWDSSETGLVRVQAMWADAELVGVDMPEGSLLNTLVKNLVTADETLYEYTRTH